MPIFPVPASLIASGGGLPALSDIPALVMGFVNPAHPEELPLLLLYAGGALSVSFTCSLLEATLLSVRVTELKQRADDGDAGAATLLVYKQEKVEEGIGAILTLNTVAHTIGASLAGAQAARVFASETLSADAAVAGFSALLTVAVLVATEIIPKTLGTNYASQLAGFVGTTISWLAFFLKPVLVVTGALTSLISRGEPEGISRGELQAIVNMAQQDGVIAGDESRVLSNLLDFDALSVEDVMTPRTVIAMLPSTTTVADFLADSSLHRFSRLPVYEGTRDHVIGYVFQRQILLAAVKSDDHSRGVTEFLRPIEQMLQETTLGVALKRLLDSGEHIAVAQDGFGGTTGLVTLEDVVETLLGVEIVDEADEVADLRVLAEKIRDARIARRSSVVADAPVSPPPASDAEEGSA